MFLKILLLSISIPSTVIGGYYLTKNMDKLDIQYNDTAYLIVKAQDPLAKDVFRAKTSDKMYESNTKHFKCSMSLEQNTNVYDENCEIYNFAANSGSSSNPQIIDIAKIKSSLKTSTIKQKSDIVKDNFYVLKVDKYIFKNINNLTNIQLVTKQDFPNKKEFANLRVEAVLDGGNKKTELSGGNNTQLSFNKKFKSNLFLVKATDVDNSFSWDKSLKCEIGKTIKSCNAWKITTQPNTNTQWSSLNISQLDALSSSTVPTKDQYYILDINTRQEEFSENNTIKFSNNSQSPNQNNIFTVISAVFGTIKSQTPSSTTVTFTSPNNQLVFVSTQDKVHI